MENENLETQNNEATENQPGENSTKEMSVEELKAELRRVRQEAASRRIANRELEEKAKRWEEYEESQKTELQKLQEALAERDKKLANYELDLKKHAVAQEFGLNDKSLKLLTGSTEEEIREKAQILKELQGENKETSRPADLLAGNRGKPVGSTNDTKSFDDMLRAMARGGR